MSHGQTEEQTKFFTEFHRRLDRKSGIIARVADTAQKRKQVRCVLEIADIIDELNSIRRLFEARRDVLTTAVRTPEKEIRYKGLSETLRSLSEQDVGGYIKQVDRLSRDAQWTRDAVWLGEPSTFRASSTNIIQMMSLLDLQQKDESLHEAISSNGHALAVQKQAQATEAQSQILFLFTTVTIIFVRHSFFCP